MTGKNTKAVKAGRTPSLHAGAVNTPVYRASTILFPDVETMLTERQPFAYGRRGTPTTRALEEAIADLEGGARTVLTPSGLSACALAVLTVCGAGDHLLMTDSCYGPTRHFCDHLGKRFGIETTYFAPLAGADVMALARPETKAIFLESPGSYTFEVQDVPAIAAAAHARGLAVILDNSWATPIYFQAMGHGVDLSVVAATKYVGGHSDVNLGTVTANDAYKDVLAATHRTFGLTSNGDEAFLTLRGLRTLPLRMERHAHNAMVLARWLKDQPEVARVHYPALENDPGHALWRRDFTGASSIFSVVFKTATEKAVAAMIDGLELFGIGYSYGGFESLIVPARYHRSAEPKEQGVMIRIHAGLEDVADLKADLEAGLERLRRTA